MKKVCVGGGKNENIFLNKSSLFLLNPSRVKIIKEHHKHDKE